MRLSLVGPEPASASGWVCPLGPGDSLSRQTLPPWLTTPATEVFLFPTSQSRAHDAALAINPLNC